MWVIIGYVLLSLLLLIVLLLVSPVFVVAQYQNGELSMQVKLYGLPLWRYPVKRKKPAKAGQAPKQNTTKPSLLDEWVQKLKREGVFGAVRELQALAQLIGGWVGKLARAITVDRLRLRFVIASEDASATAQNVGRVCAVVYPALTAIQSVVRIRRRHVTVEPDYLAEEGLVEGSVKLHLPVIRGVWIALYALAQYTKFNSRKETEEDVQHGKQGE